MERQKRCAKWLVFHLFLSAIEPFIVQLERCFIKQYQYITDSPKGILSPLRLPVPPRPRAVLFNVVQYQIKRVVQDLETCCANFVRRTFMEDEMRRAEPPSPGLGPQLRDFDSTFSAWQAIAKEWPSLFKPKADEVPRLPHPMNVDGGFDE